MATKLLALAALASDLSPASAALAPAASADDGFALTLLSAPGAVCLDGTRAGFYLRPGSPSSFGPAYGADTWIIELEGGGWCVSLADCLARAKTDIGSSASWPAVGVPGMDGGANGMLSGDCSVNKWCNASKVHINYCDGGSLAGSAGEVSAPGGVLHFNGAAIFDAAVDAILLRGMSSAKNIILKGCSAGGLADFLHADYFHARMATEVPGAAVVTMPDAGFFRDLPTFTGQPGYSPLYRWVFEAMNVTQTNAACLAAYTPANETWRCMFAEYVLPHIATPLYITQDLADSWQMHNILQLPCDASKRASCTAAENAAVDAFRIDMLTALAPIFSSATNGAYLSSCVQHCHQNVGSWNGERVGNFSVQQAFDAWWSRSGAAPRILVDGPVGTNAHCA